MITPTSSKENRVSRQSEGTAMAIPYKCKTHFSR